MSSNANDVFLGEMDEWWDNADESTKLEVYEEFIDDHDELKEQFEHFKRLCFRRELSHR